MFSIKTQIRKKFIGTDSRSKKMYKNTVAMIGIRGVSMILTLIEINYQNFWQRETFILLRRL